MKLIVNLLIVFFVSSLFAVDVSSPNNLGFSAGELSRNGISFRHWNSDWGYQLTGMILSSKDDIPERYDYREGPSSNYDYFAYGREFKTNFGFSIMKTLQSVNYRRFYLLAGYGLYHKEQKRWQSDEADMDDAWEDGYKVINTHFWGIGVGFDLEIYDFTRVYIEIPLTFKSNNEINMYIPQIGIFYRF